MVSPLQQQLFQVTQERGEVCQRVVSDNVQLQLLRTLPNFWSLLHDAEVLNCPIKSRLRPVPSQVPGQPLSPTTGFPSQGSEPEPEPMEGVETFSVIPAGDSSVETHQTSGLAAPTGPSSQIQHASSSSGNDRFHANGYVAPNLIMKLSNNLIRV